MYQRISMVGFWLGLACVLMTIVFRGLAAVGIWPNLVPAVGAGITYVTFHRAAEVLLLLSIAAKLVGHSQNEKS